ncbi:MAG: hypothetical protein ACK5Y2_13545 [Bdellovibrionales bacterium]
MAKIFLIARERNATVESLIQSLETDQQSFYLHLTQEPSIRHFFLIWASYLRIKPDLVYFILEDERLNSMELALLETLGSVPHQSTAATFIGLVDYKKSRILQKFLQRVDLLTLPSRQNLADLRGLNSSSRRQLRTLLPPMPSFNFESPTPPSPVEQEVLRYSRQGSTWIMPWDFQYFETHKSFLSSVAKEKTWIFLGDRSDWKFHQYEEFQAQVEHWKYKPLWSGSLSDGALNQLFRQSEVILLSGYDCKPSEFVKLASLAASTGLFTLLDTHQIELFSGLWAVGENCQLLEKDFVQQELENRWISGSLVPKSLKKKPRSPSNALDESLNELNRWITKTLTERKMA